MMTRSNLILFAVLLTSPLLAKAQRDPYEDFRGQKFCATRTRGPDGTCCANRLDECSVPIAGTLCYCDEFCDQHINPDCCPDYQPVCRGLKDDHRDPGCIIGGVHINALEKLTDNCNECKCGYEGNLTCERDPCLSDPSVVTAINRDAARLGWKAANYTQFYGRKLKAGLQLRLGTFEPRLPVKRMNKISNAADQFPLHFSSLLEWPGAISEIRDQGWCGSSWAVSTASVASDRMGIKTKTTIDLSSQHLLSCVRHQQGCVGGHLDNAWRYLNRLGVGDEECYPYDAAVGRCRASKLTNLKDLGCSIPEYRPTENLYKMGPAYSLFNETDIMYEIKNYGPVQATMWVYQDFFTYRSGIYRRSSHGNNQLKGFHSVRLIGWGEESFGYQRTKYWIAANSWGNWWGEGGFFKILRGTNECSIESYVIGSLPEIHDSKPKEKKRKRSGRRTKA